RRLQRPVAAVAGGYQAVAHEAVAPDPFDRRSREQLAEARIVERQQLGKPRRRQLGPRQERLVPRGGLRELVPRANGQGIVAAVDAISDPRAEFVRDRPFKLDRQIGNAAPGIELERGRESLGGASILAGRAGPATLVMAKVRLERQR